MAAGAAASASNSSGHEVGSDDAGDRAFASPITFLSRGKQRVSDNLISFRLD